MIHFGNASGSPNPPKIAQHGAMAGQKCSSGKSKKLLLGRLASFCWIWAAPYPICGDSGRPKPVSRRYCFRLWLDSGTIGRQCKPGQLGTPGGPSTPACFATPTTAPPAALRSQPRSTGQNARCAGSAAPIRAMPAARNKTPRRRRDHEAKREQRPSLDQQLHGTC